MSGIVMYDSWEGVIIFCIDMTEEFNVWYANEIVLNCGVLFFSSSWTGQLCGQYMYTSRLRMHANALNEDSRTTDRGSSASLGIGLAWHYRKRYADFGLGADIWEFERPGSKKTEFLE